MLLRIQHSQPAFASTVNTTLFPLCTASSKPNLAASCSVVLYPKTIHSLLQFTCYFTATVYYFVCIFPSRSMPRMCQCCQNHGIASPLGQLKGHKKRCRFRKHGQRKKCEICKVTLERQIVMAKQIKFKRKKDLEWDRKQNPALRNHPGEVSDSDDLESDIEETVDPEQTVKKIDQTTQTIQQEPLPVFQEAMTNRQSSSAMEQLLVSHFTALQRFALEQPSLAFHMLSYLPENDPFCLMMKQSNQPLQSSVPRQTTVPPQRAHHPTSRSLVPSFMSGTSPKESSIKEATPKTTFPDNVLAIQTHNTASCASEYDHRVT